MIGKNGRNAAGIAALILTSTGTSVIAGQAITGQAGAAPPDDPDIAVLAGPCASCHGPDGVSPGEIPSIAGRSAAELRERMLGFRDGASDAQATVMPRLMRGYSPAEIDQLAAYFAGLPQAEAPE